MRSTRSFLLLGALLSGACNGSTPPLHLGAGGSDGTATAASAAMSSSIAGPTVQSASSQAAVATVGVGGSGAGGSMGCNPPPAADSLFALNDYRLGDVAPTSMCQYRGDVLLIMNIAEL